MVGNTQSEPLQANGVSGDWLSGHWEEQLQLKHLFYGTGCVRDQMLGALPSESSKVLVITGNSLANKTPLVHQLETLLGPYHAGTFAGVRQHGPVADVERAMEMIHQNPAIDTIVSLGGGSPIDTAKTLSYKKSERTGTFLTHLTIPTTLSAAECTAGGGYTAADGVKVGFMSPEMGVTAIFYDPDYTRYTPRELWLSSGIRALDHAVECFYHPSSSEVPWKALSAYAVRTLFEDLPRSASTAHGVDDDIAVRLLLAAFASSGLKGKNIKGGMGLSHSLGHALGSPYGIPHGITSCLTLAGVVELKAKRSQADATQIARLLTSAGGMTSGDSLKDALEVANRIRDLVKSLGLPVGTLTSWNVPRDEVSLIVRRGTGATSDEMLRNTVRNLIESLF